MQTATESHATDPTSLRVLIADDHEMILEMFEMFLSNLPDIAVTTARTLDEALERIAETGRFDIVLLDLDMPGMNGIDGLRRAIERNGEKSVAILTGNPTPRMVEEIMASGASGIIPKTVPLRSLANALRFMAAGERYIPMELLREKPGPRNKATGAPLSEKEMMVLSCLAEGLSNREIGKALSLAEPTIKMHVRSICKKLEVNNRTHAVITAQDLGLI